MKTKKASMLCALLMAAGCALRAQEPVPVMQFDFSDVSGTAVRDERSGVTARVMGAARVVEMGGLRVLDLGRGTGYLDLTAQAGAVFAAQADHTVSVYYRVDEDASLAGNGHFLWAFSTLPACGATTGCYSGYRLNAQRLAFSPGGYQQETGYSLGAPSPQGRWMHVAYTQRGTSVRFYLNGQLQGSVTGMPTNSRLFADTKPSTCWMGRAPFSSDSYLKQTLVADFRLYGEALTAEQVEELAAGRAGLEYAYRYGTAGDFTPLGTLLDTCKDFLAQADNGYAPNARAELQDAVELAQTDYDARRVSQRVIDRHLAALQRALQQAQASAGFAYHPATRFEAGTQGFRHPGGLHTEADFVRIRQALAEGEPRITQAWQRLCANAYAQSDVQTWPVETIVRGGSGGQNYMNVARGAAMAYQNALRWKIGGTREHAEAAVRILMAWARGNKYVSGDTNLSLAAGIYGYELAQAAELVRDYEGWSPADFETFKRYMMQTWYPAACDFVRRRHDTWQNSRYAQLGERPGHYWSNWGLCNVLCLMSIGILCDDVHIYNQGVSFYKYDHVGTFRDRSGNTVILNDGCAEFLGNLVPVVLPDSRGPLGRLGQMQESGRDQGHALMALGLALDICQVAYNQGDDLFAYMDDRLAAGLEHVAALNFGGVSAASLPWITYNYADCRTSLGAGWAQTGPNEGGKGGHRPYWDRALGYYEGVRGVKLPYAQKAAAAVGIDGGGGDYGQTSGGFDHLGFSTLTCHRPAVEASQAPVVLSGDIEYKGVTYSNQTNLGGLGYTYAHGKTRAVPADGADIRLIPQLPHGVEDTGQWTWDTGETTRILTVKADRSRIHRVTYTAANGVQSEQAFAIAVAGDCQPDLCATEITLEGTAHADTTASVLYGSSLRLHMGNSTGWTDDYTWDNGQTGSSAITLPAITHSRTYTCQYVNQGGYVNERRFHIRVQQARQHILIGTAEQEASEARVLPGTDLVLRLVVPAASHPDEITWSDGSHGTDHALRHVLHDTEVTASYRGTAYTYKITVKDTPFGYYTLLTADKGYTLVTSADALRSLADTHYFVWASDQADLLIGLHPAPKNGNRALFFQTPADPLTDLSQVFTLETYGEAFCLRNLAYDGLLLQTEWNRPDQLRTHDQPLPCEWTRLMMVCDGNAWTVENGKYAGNWLGLWTPENGYRDGEEIACNRQGDDIARLQLFAIAKSRFHADYLAEATAGQPKDATPLLVNPDFTGNGYGWNIAGSWGNQRYNGAGEVWHSKDFHYWQTLDGLPDGWYTVSCQLANGDGTNTAVLYAESGSESREATVSQWCGGSNFDAQRDRMAADTAYARLAVDIRVTGGTLTLGLREPAAGTTWLVWDRFALWATGGTPSSIAAGRTGFSPSRGTYDLCGRRLQHSRKRGICVEKGRKVVR